MPEILTRCRPAPVLIRFLPIRLSIMPVINSRGRAAGLWLIMAREISLSDWVASGLWALRDRGRITSSPDRTDEVMAAFRDGGLARFYCTLVADSPAVRMITARKGVKVQWHCCPGWYCIAVRGVNARCTKIMKGGDLSTHPAPGILQPRFSLFQGL